MKIRESLKGTEGVTDRHVRELINDCIDDINSKTGFYIDNDIMWMFGEGAHTFGTTYFPTYDVGDFTIVLNKHMVGEEDDAIKNTILHELCHYIHNKEMLDDGILYWVDDDTLKYTKYYQRGRDSSHGTRWKEIAKEVTRTLQLKQPITTRGNFNTHTNVGNYAKQKAKYTIVCKNCGHEYYYNRLTNVVRLVMQDKDDKLRCGICNKYGMFEIKK